MTLDIDLASKLQHAAMFFPSFLFALCFHEFAHGWMARRKGDRTAEIMGRLTMNPVAHADLLGTVVLPLMAALTNLPLFGWAKPVPVNPRNLSKPKQDMFWIAIAGPASNMLLAVLGTIGLFAAFAFVPGFERADDGTRSMALSMAAQFIGINVFLAVFNMLPLHPLDGGKVLARFLPENWNRTLEDAQPYTSFILIGLFVTGAFALIMTPASALAQILVGIGFMGRGLI